MGALVSARAQVVVAAGLLLLVAGCYDFGALGGADLAAALPADLAPAADLSSAASDGGSCGCGQGYNCVAGGCVVAPADCATLHAQYLPAILPDGVYWLNYNGLPHRVYCDMTTGSILCAKDGLEPHSTRTRDGQNRSVNWTSSMSADESSCAIWNVRGDDQRPFSPLTQNGVAKLQTCQGLGFVRDVSVGGCAYGMNNSANADKGKCGFDSSPDWLTYYNSCAVWSATATMGCKQGGGKLAYWQLQGPMFNVGVMSTADGTQKTVCATH